MILRRTAIAVAMVAAVCHPASAQTTEGLLFRPFFVASAQQFTAHETFDAAFGETVQTLWGGGLSITYDDVWYVDLTASRFQKTGQQAFFNAGTAYQLGIPMSVTMTPFEVTVGHRFHLVSKKLPPLNRRPIEPSPFIPYIGGGVGVYRYQQTSDFATAAENVDTRHAGAVLEGGVEIRLHRWFGVAFDGHYTYVPGILGEGGVSKQAGESDLGGFAGRVKVIVGR